MIYKIRDFQDVSERILEAHKVLGEFVQQVYKDRNQQVQSGS